LLNKHSIIDPPPLLKVKGKVRGKTDVGAKLVGIFTIIVNLACLGLAKNVNGKISGKVPYSTPLLISIVYPKIAAKSIKSCSVKTPKKSV
jgi:hypothetical protein